MSEIPWFKVDDGFWSHPKVVELSPEAVALWVRAGSYAAQHLTDGRVTTGTLRMLAADRDAACELVDAGLWDADGDRAWVFHDWQVYQPASIATKARREEVSKARSEAGKAGAAARWKHTDSNPDGNLPEAEPSTADGNAMAPSRPVPSRPEDLTLTTESSHVVDAGVSTDSELSPAVKALAGFAGISNVRAIALQIRAHTQRDVGPEQAVTVARHLLSKAKREPTSPQRYVMRAISLSPAEVQQYIDEGGLAA